uniref:Lysozyme C, milk isozyme-like isoform X1 n=1 Tax=Geotrypetes seraphini TaxID=260995 RepID=A0A6P8Q6P9_GEOSA|nr:lysozyme C, milk isozyme-like isoform X1 [Geotrypetes seraphini]
MAAAAARVLLCQRAAGKAVAWTGATEAGGGPLHFLPGPGAQRVREKYQENCGITYACLANSASQYNTSFQGSPSEYGMFQISNFWCNSKSGENNPCGISCAKLMDSNISDDIQCVKRIVQDPKGLDSWDPWVNSCKGRDLIGFICKT